MWLVITLCTFYAARWFSKKVPHPINNPILISLLVLIPLLLTLDVPYQQYAEQNQWLSYLLEPAVVALAYPLYEQLPVIRAKWRIILLTCTVGSVMSMFTGGLIALMLGADASLIASLLPKSVTTPIAMAVSEQLGGEASISAALVILAGLFGAIFAYPIYQCLGITSSLAKGLTMGTVSHALGTAKSTETHYQDGAFSSLALVVCGVITSLLAPLIFSVIMLFV